MATIPGTSGNDNLAGTSAADLILGDQGNDNIVGNGGQDSLYGGMGNDFIIYGSGSSSDLTSAIVYGGAGSDTIEGNDNYSLGNNTIYGGTGNATTDATDGANFLNLSNDGGSDVVYLGGGGDTVELGYGVFNSVTGGAGNDLIDGDFFSGGSRAVINANAGNDTVFGTSGGGDSIHGGKGNDVITLQGNSTAAGSLVAADLGDDTISDNFAGGNNSLYGGKGNDQIFAGGAGNDLIFAGLDSDTITYSGSGQSSIYGGSDTTGQAADAANFIDATGSSGRDLLVGGGGNDSISVSTAAVGGGKNVAVDTVTGGLGNDTFAFGAATGVEGYGNATATNGNFVDSVTDFVSGKDSFQFADVAGPFANDVTGVDTSQNNTTNTQTLAQAATASLAFTGGKAADRADIFSYGNTNYLVVDVDGSGSFNTGDYLVGVNNLTSLKKTDSI